MSDAIKRSQGTAGKPTPPDDTSIENVVRSVVGSSIVLQTVPPHAQTLEGQLYIACSRTNLVVIATGSGPALVYHVLPISTLASFTILSLPSDAQQTFAPSAVNTSAILTRANTAVTKARDKATKINKNVERATQEIFDALDKQFTARWKDQDIVVMERVVVRSPGYRGEDCKVITTDGEGLLGRVRKVLENERKHSTQREGSKNVKPAVPNIMPAFPVSQGGLRKGG